MSLTPESIQEFFDAVRADDVFGVTTLADGEPALVNAHNASGLSPLMYAIYYGKKDIVNLLLVSGAEVNVFEAAALGKQDRVRELLESDKTLVSAYSADGWTPLHVAAFFGQKAAAEALLEAGASVSARSTNANRNQPLHAAAAGKSRTLVALLVEHGADVNATQEGGWAPLHAAAQNKDPEMARVLLAHGADPNARAGNRQSPLDLALISGSQELVDLLRESGAE